VDPPEYLRVILADARALGYEFATVWMQCVIRAARISSTPGPWLEVLIAQRDVWERAFDGMPSTAPEQAIASVAHSQRPDRSLDARRCQQCDRWVPSDRDPRALFCDERCRRQWNYELERGRAEAGRPAE
jgi:hypothetical protein